MRFIGYLSDVGNTSENQDAINAERARLAHAGTVEAWVVGDTNRIGYPFVLSCDQPDAYLPELVDAYTGKIPAARLWGTWDGLRVGTRKKTVSLHTAIRRVFEQRRAEGRIDMPEDLLYVLAGKVIIESGGTKHAHSSAGARGIMQLSRQVIQDCRIPKKFEVHRLAQIDCALSLLQQNHRNLIPAFSSLFAHLPDDKQARLRRMLLVQAYHGGIGRVISLLQDPTLNRPASYFATHHARYTAEDIALGMVFHNLGREALGFASLYYVTDVHIAADAACARVDLPGCPTLPV